MKTLHSLRRPVLLALLVAASLTACKKDKETEPEPDLASRAAGQYTFSELAFGGKTYPASSSNLKGGVTVTRQTATTVELKLNVNQKSDNEPFMDGSAGGILLTDVGNGEFDLNKDGEKLGRGSKNKLVLNGEDDNDVRFTITFTK
ncbi:MAG: hypothetical protein H7Z75_03025 [Ferruginibacter sp.]|nr:hypothetical protein [Cytophagales bacterium]